MLYRLLGVINSIRFLPNADKIANQYYDDMVASIMKCSKVKLQEYQLLEFFKELLKEIASQENVSVLDIRELGYGKRSCVYALGNKVIKVGEDRITPFIPYHPAILLPLLRKRFDISSSQNQEILFVEVAEKIIRKDEWALGKTETEINEILYQLYREIRSTGYVWFDVIPENVGKLTRDNKAYCEGITDIDLDFIMMINESTLPKVTKKAGDFVVLDTECFVREELLSNALKCLSPSTEASVLELEERYQREKASLDFPKVKIINQ